MPKCKAAPRPVVTPSSVLRMFMSGMDTADIASHFSIREHEAYRLLRISREAQRLFNGANRNPLPPVNKPAVESQ